MTNPSGCYCTECLRKIDDMDSFELDGLCNSCRKNETTWQKRHARNPSLPAGWQPDMDKDDTLFLWRLLLFQAGIATGSYTGRAVLDARVTTGGLWIKTSDGIVELKTQEVVINDTATQE